MGLKYYFTIGPYGPTIHRCEININNIIESYISIDMVSDLHVKNKQNCQLLMGKTLGLKLRVQLSLETYFEVTSGHILVTATV